MAVCFVFLWPSLRWYFMIPKDQQALALGSREQIRTYATQTAQQDIEELLTAANKNGPIPAGLDFLLPIVK
jgi:preprotein translocase subunit SecD